MKKCRRIDTVKPKACRPVKISFDTKEAATTILSRSRGLRLTSEFKSVYVSPDRSVEERETMRQLVATLKEKMKSEPDLYHFIRNGTLHSAERKPAAAKTDPPSTPVRPPDTPSIPTPTTSRSFQEKQKADQLERICRQFGGGNRRRS